MSYYVLDENGCLNYEVLGGIIPEGAVHLDFDHGNPPHSFWRYHFASKTWVDPLTSEHRRSIQSYEIVKKRNQLLLETDWTQLPDVPLETKDAWASYRQALRDVPEQSGYPFDIVWPQPPN